MDSTNRLGRSLCALFALILPLSAQTDVLTQHNDLARTGANLHETRLTPATVSGRSFGMIFKRSLDDQPYSQPLVASAVKIANAVRDVVYVTTVNNSVYAFDADDPGASAPLWHVNLGAPASLQEANFGCLDMNGNVGIVGTPAINAEKTALYVVALSKTALGYEQNLHALDPATGADLPHSPVAIQAPGFDPLLENQRPGLLLSGGKVYIGYASHCDKLPYHGFLLAYDAITLEQRAVFNASPGGEAASIWQSGQAPAADDRGNIYVITGNGSWNGTTQFSESFLKLDAQLKLLDWFTPSNHAELDAHDADLDSAGATLIPGTHLVVGGGKQGILYLLDTANLGHLGDPHAFQHERVTGSHMHSLVYWKSERNGDLLYVWGRLDQLRAYKLSGAGENPKLSDEALMIRPEKNTGEPGAMLSLSANGGRDGLLWAAILASGDSWHESAPGILHAYDADNLGRELWNSLENAARDDCGRYAKMSPPTIANGKVYLVSFGERNTGTGQLCVYGLLPGQPESKR